MRVLRAISRLSAERRREVYEQVGDMSMPTRSFYVMAALSAVIAAYGLLANSAAVVIGAMVVAPLMGPIFGIALGLVIGDRRLTVRAIISETLGVLLSLSLAALIGLVPLRIGLGSEILARTEPTLYDIVVALASGLAGAYALVNERLSPALPGVAIAVALVPPLASCGICIASARWASAGGAFLLFLANLLAIEIAAALVFAVFGIARTGAHDSLTVGRFFRRFGLSLAALVVVGTFMTQTLLGLIAERRFSRALQERLSQEIRTTTGAQLSDVRHSRHGKETDVIATVLTPQDFEPTQVGGIEAALRQRVDPTIHLVIRSLQSKDADRNGPVFIAGEELERRAEVEAQTRFLTEARAVLTAQFGAVAGADVADVRRDLQAGREVVTADVRTPTPIDPAEVAAAEDALAKATAKHVRLIVRSVLTQYADAQQFLYQPQNEEPKPLTGAALRLHNRLKQALNNQLGREIGGASLTDFRYARRDGRLLLLAVARTPRTFRGWQVRRVEGQLREYVDPAIDLVVRSEVGADTGPEGYVAGFDEAALATGGGGEG